jgi:hypothetical protein
VDEVTSDEKKCTSPWMLMEEDHRQWVSQKKRGEVTEIRG